VQAKPGVAAAIRVRTAALRIMRGISGDEIAGSVRFNR
jgi:hypothetical protein